MTPNIDNIHKLLEFVGSLSLITGAMAWWRKGSEDEDKVMAQAADELLNAISDADMVNKIENFTNLNVRDQMSIADAEDWHLERTLRSFKRRN